MFQELNLFYFEIISTFWEIFFCNEKLSFRELFFFYVFLDWEGVFDFSILFILKIFFIVANTFLWVINFCVSRIFFLIGNFFFVWRKFFSFLIILFPLENTFSFRETRIFVFSTEYSFLFENIFSSGKYFFFSRIFFLFVRIFSREYFFSFETTLKKQKKVTYLTIF